VRLNERIGHITGELRAFSRKSARGKEPVSLKDALNSAMLLNRARSRENRIRVVQDDFASQIKVIGGRIRLEQVFVNLLQNAFEALEHTPDPIVRITTTVDGDWVWVRISDNGPGLAPEVVDHLFSPFVTTKENGLGLGLVIAHDILRDFGGDLTAHNGSVGAVFELKLRKVSA
jgi:two-component system C4-dicarboxylate transport sensor histidine kinase DctB